MVFSTGQALFLLLAFIVGTAVGPLIKDILKHPKKYFE
ncbi:hypothetical protein FRFR103141_02385 [Fructilactobacillus fructivorans]